MRINGQNLFCEGCGRGPLFSEDATLYMSAGQSQWIATTNCCKAKLIHKPEVVSESDQINPGA